MTMNPLTATMGPTGDPNKHIGDLTTADESLQLEVVNMRESLLGPKTKIRLRAWNLRTMYETS